MRDNDKDWEAFGAEAPYHAVLTNPMFLPDALTQERMDYFFRTGEDEVGKIVGTIRQRIDPHFQPARAIDFGCGVGRISLAVADYAKTTIGLDVSPSMLREAQKNRAQRKPRADIQFQHDVPEQPVDWVCSVLVFQHIQPARGIPILKSLLSRLAVGGVVSLQFTAYRTPTHLHRAFEEVDFLRFDGTDLNIMQSTFTHHPRMSMYDYDMTEVLAAYAAAGIGEMWVEHVDHAGHHAFWVMGRRGGG